MMIVPSKIDLHGVLLFNKPPILSSNTALQKVKRLFLAKKAGHTGTLDPMATGLLPICFGEATKFAGLLLDADKEYIATVKLGQATTTYDADGDITVTHDVVSTELEIRSVVETFIGQITQIPPIYSALKVNGKALYEYARSNQEVLINSRQITIKEIEIIEFIAKDIFKIRVLASKGTYIRTLAHDIGIKLHCGAHLIGLIRTKTSGFKLNDEITLDNLSKMSFAELNALILPVDALVADLTKLELNDDEFAYIKNGHEFKLNRDTIIGQNKKISLYYQNSFLGTANLIDKKIKPIRLMNTSILR